MIDPFEQLWDEKFLQAEIVNLFGEFDPMLWSLDAGTGKTFDDWLASGKSVEDYYRDEIGFVYQPAWNGATNDERSKAMAAQQAAREFGCTSALDWGAGIGTVAVPLAMMPEMKKVVAAEICLPCINMLKQRKKQFGLESLQITDLKEKGIRAKFDMIVSTEVLEHVEDPEGMMVKMDKRLKPGGIAIMSWSFVKMPTHLPQHFDAGLQASHPDTVTTEGFGKKVMIDVLGYEFVRWNWFNNMLWHKPEEISSG